MQFDQKYKTRMIRRAAKRALAVLQEAKTHLPKTRQANAFLSVVWSARLIQKVYYAMSLSQVAARCFDRREEALSEHYGHIIQWPITKIENQNRRIGELWEEANRERSEHALADHWSALLPFMLNVAIALANNVRKICLEEIVDDSDFAALLKLRNEFTVTENEYERFWEGRYDVPDFGDMPTYDQVEVFKTVTERMKSDYAMMTSLMDKAAETQAYIDYAQHEINLAQATVNLVLEKEAVPCLS